MRALLAAIAVLLVTATAASAAPQPRMVVWSGGGQAPLRGVRVDANGSGKLLRVEGEDRGDGKVTVAGTVSPSSGELSAIRKAAKAATGAPIGTGFRSEDSAYASAFIMIGAKKHAVVGLNDAPPELSALIAALNAALPDEADLADPTKPVVQAASFPDTTGASCPGGREPTTVAREISLKDAAAAGIVKIEGKGGYPAGDKVSVQTEWHPIDGPTVVRVSIELVTTTNLTETEFEQAVESRFQNLKTSGGEPVTVDLDVRRRAPDAAPTPCYHQIQITNDVGLQDTVSHNFGTKPTDHTEPIAGEWAYGRGPFVDGNLWAHETGHLFGLDDTYDEHWRTGGVNYKIAGEDGQKIATEDKQVLEAWKEANGFKNSVGAIVPIPRPGHFNDLMGGLLWRNSPPLHQDAVDQLATQGGQRINILGNPGDLLLAKNPPSGSSARQNMGVATEFQITAERGGGPVRADGLVAYCIDSTRAFPDKGLGFDVLGNAADQPEPGMQALARVLREIARRQKGPLDDPPSALEAVWRVTDNHSVTSEEGRSILRAANVPESGDLGTPHPTNPNGASPQTRSVSRSGVDPLVPLPPEPPLPVAPESRLTRVAVTARRLRASRQKLAVLNAIVTIAGADSQVTLTLERRAGRKFKRVRRYPPRALEPGETLISLPVRGFRSGTYRLSATGAGTTKRVTFTVR